MAIKANAEHEYSETDPTRLDWHRFVKSKRRSLFRPLGRFNPLQARMIRKHCYCICESMSCFRGRTAIGLLSWVRPMVIQDA